MGKKTLFSLNFIRVILNFVLYSILDLLSLVNEEGQQIKRKNLIQAVRKAFKVAADSSCQSISLPLPKEIVHLTEDLFTNIL